jgi:outer membrane receptor protein involved in Fe transport
MALLSNCNAQGGDAARLPTNILGQPLEAALRSLADDRGFQIVFAYEELQGLNSVGVSGQFTTDEAIGKLLSGTRLRHCHLGGNTITIVSDLNVGAPSVTNVALFQLQDDPAPRMRVAQAEPPPSGPSTGDVPVESLEHVLVTGSNIKRIESENVLPVTVLDQSAIEARNAVTPLELLSSLPQVTNAPLNESGVGFGAARGDAATINLRGIGPSNSLVLLNGRRLTPHPTSGTTTYAVNINQLPTQGLSRIDVLRDGASAIYGSDAVAGVINYITRTDFRGAQAKVRYGYPEQGGGENLEATLTFGTEFGSGRGRLMTTVDAFQREPIYLTERDFSASANNAPRAPAPWNVAGSQFDGRPTVGLYPTFRIGSAAANNYFRPVNGTPTLTNVAPTRTNNPEYYLNGNSYVAGLPRTGRINSFTSIEFDINDRLTAFSDISLYSATSTTYRQPVSLNAPASSAPAIMGVDNPFNPYGSYFYHPSGTANPDGTARLVGTPQSISIQSGLVADMPPSKLDVHAGTYRIVAGLRGDLTDSWSWESGALYTRTYSVDEAPYSVRESLLDRSMSSTGPAAFNPFGYTFRVANGGVVADQPYTNPKSVMDSFVQPWEMRGEATLASIDARASGSLFEIWSGEVSLAVGAEYREEEFATSFPTYVGLNPEDSGLDPANNDFLIAAPRPNNGGDRNIVSAYAETVIPLAAPRNAVPFVELLEFTASVRHERYSDFGETTKPKFAINWKPFSAVMVRASYNEGFTAPSLPVLHLPSSFTLQNPPGTVDTYREPVTREGAYVSRSGTAGNPDLQPVHSEGKSAGIVLDIPWVERLTLSADYWQIKQTGVIGSRAATDIRVSDTALLRAYMQEQMAAGVPIGSIDLGSATASYRGDPSVVRLAPTASDLAAFAAYNAANPGSPFAAVGPIFQVNAKTVNLSEGYTSGWDFTVRYDLPGLSVGDFSMSTDWSYVKESYTKTENAVTQLRGVGPNAKWRGTTTLSWKYDDWSAGLSAFYIGEGADETATTTLATYESLDRPSYITRIFSDGAYSYRYNIEETWSFNGFAGRRFDSGNGSWFDQSEVKLGVVNLTDEAPPLAAGFDGFGYSSGVHGRLLPGRTWTLELVKRF